MKKLILAFLALTICGCWGPDLAGAEYTYTCTVVNESGHVIKVEAYESYTPSISPIITILDVGASLKREYKCHSGRCIFNYTNFFGQKFEKDSLKVIFKTDSIPRVLFFTDSCIYGKKNPLNHCEYGLKNKETFIFTKEHFENAQPCNDCE